MTYTVTFETIADNRRPGPSAIDSGRPREFTLEQALAHASELLREGRLNVTIRDSISFQVMIFLLAAKASKALPRISERVNQAPIRIFLDRECTLGQDGSSAAEPILLASAVGIRAEIGPNAMGSRPAIDALAGQYAATHKSIPATLHEDREMAGCR